MRKEWNFWYIEKGEAFNYASFMHMNHDTLSYFLEKQKFVESKKVVVQSSQEEGTVSVDQ